MITTADHSKMLGSFTSGVACHSSCFLAPMWQVSENGELSILQSLIRIRCLKVTTQNSCAWNYKVLFKTQHFLLPLEIFFLF